MRRGLATLALYTATVFVAAGCKPANTTSVVDGASGASSVAEEQMDQGLLGYFPREDSAVGELLSASVQQVNLAIAGSPQEFKFVKCETRMHFPDTKDKKECGYVINDPKATYVYGFKPLTPNGDQCSMGYGDCKIYQTITVLAPNNGLQRPPFFMSTKPAGDKMMLVSYGVFFSQELGVRSFLRRWIESDQFVPVILNPYAIPKTYGQELAAALGNCGGQIMNLIHLSRDALASRESRKKPVAVSGIVVNSAILATEIVAGGGLFRLAPRYIAHGFIARGTAAAALGALQATGGVLTVFSDWANLQAARNRYKPGSSERQAIDSALVIAQMGQWASFAQMKSLSNAQIKKTAKVLMWLGSAAAGAISLTEYLSANAPKDLERFNMFVEALRQGDVPVINREMCELQVLNGLRSSCPSKPPQAPTCK
jgi:hypothetical protein